MKYEQLSQVAEYVSNRVDAEKLSLDNYISTENMIPDRGGVTRSSKLPAVKTVSSFSKNDILISNIRPYFKKIWYANKNGGCSNDVLVIRAKEGIDPKFLYYVLSTDTFFNYTVASSKGTKMPRGDKHAIMQYKVPSFSIDRQLEIASILSALDDKIELNRKMNATLEEMAQAIFKEWFVNKPSTYAKLGDICNCVLGGTPSRSRPEYWNGNIPWINSSKINELRIITPSEWITDEGLKNSSTHLLPAKTTVLAITGATLGQVSLLEIETCANQSVIGIEPNEKMPYTFIYPWVLTNINFISSFQTGGAQQHINKGNVENLEVPIYKPEEIITYSELVKPLYECIAHNYFENTTLEQTKNTLLLEFF